MDQKIMFKQMIDFQKNTFDNSFKAMATLQEQGEKMVSMFLEQAHWLPAEGKKAVDDWLKAYNKGREDFKKAVDDNFGKVQEYFSAAE
ncbi:MAG: hypothetical protein GY749_39755 [Desulfobacteraceae bacterium]|nr:hypothetical protein [Desulfobacteraceae bacterium]MCP4350457.1 hypothetical protein [Desulfobacterales bacterium]